MTECPLCKGEGVLRYETAERERSTGAVMEETSECTECFGVGKVEEEPDGDAAMEAQWGEAR